MCLRFWCGRAFCRSYWRVREKLDFLPHIPTLLLSFVFWWFYQVYACGYLAFVENNFLLQAVYGFVVCSGIGMTTASVYGTTLQRYPTIPSKFSVGSDFGQLSDVGKQERFEEIIRKTGANPMHTTRVCSTCQIVKSERSHHCAICNRCIPRMDHHCVALHKCIHYKNQKQFSLFVFWMVFSLAVAIVTLHPYIMQTHCEAIEHEEMLRMGPASYFISIYTWFYSRYLGRTYTFRSMIIVCLVLSSILTYFLLVIFSFVFINFMWFCNLRNSSILACNKSTTFSKKFPCISFKKGNNVGKLSSHIRQRLEVLANTDCNYGHRWMVA